MSNQHTPQLSVLEVLMLNANKLKHVFLLVE